MAGLPEALNVRAWYRGVFFTGGALLLGGGASGDRLIAILGLGMLLIGWGEWLNHAFRTTVGPGYVKSGEPRRSNIIGLTLALAGVALCGLASWRMVEAEFRPAAASELKTEAGRKLDLPGVREPRGAASATAAGRPSGREAEKPRRAVQATVQQPATH